METSQDLTNVHMFVTGLVLVTCCIAVLLVWFKNSVSRRQGAQNAFEIQVLREGSLERESLIEWETCTKNPDHAGFIPASEFRMEHLPIEYQTDDWFFFIKNMSDLTVRLRVNAVSPHRPKTGPYSLDLGNETHTGTGYIGGLKIPDGPCPCCYCGKAGGSSQTNQKWWLLMVTTAAHVVFDEHEVKATNVDLFYDDGKALKDRRMITIRGCDLKGASDHVDACLFYCAIHDEALAKLIKERRTNVIEMWKRLKENIVQNQADRPPTKAILISHPHARPKMITVGDIKTVSPVGRGDGESEYAWQMFDCAYTTGSCPGSSGGHILWLGDLRMGDIGHGWWFGTHCKSGKEVGVNHGARLCIKRNSAMFWKRNTAAQASSA